MIEENAALKQSSEQLQYDLTMLQETIGAIGDKGDDWLGQLRFLYEGQKRENDRQGLLLRGHARIVLLQLIQHFDSDHSMTLNTSELAAAEAFLSAGFPEIDIKQLEGKVSSQRLVSHTPYNATLTALLRTLRVYVLLQAAAGGVTIADLEPLLLMHLGADQVPSNASNLFPGKRKELKGPAAGSNEAEDQPLLEVVVQTPPGTPPKSSKRGGFMGMLSA